MNLVGWIFLMVVFGYFCLKSFCDDSKLGGFVMAVCTAIAVTNFFGGMMAPMELVSQSEVSPTVCYYLDSFEEEGGSNCYIIQTKDGIRFRCTDGSEKKIRMRKDDKVNTRYIFDDDGKAKIVIKEITRTYEQKWFLVREDYVFDEKDIEVCLPDNGYMQYAYMQQ